MPIVLGLDVSLSMSRLVKPEGGGEETSRKQFAIGGLTHLLDLIGANLKLEFTSLVLFSYLWEQLVPFTRDIETIKAALNTVGDYNKTCFGPVLNALGSIVIDEWGGSTPVQVILVTDGSCGVGTGSLKSIIDAWMQGPEGEKSKCPLPFPFKSKLHIVCMASQNDPDLRNSLPLYQKLIELNNNDKVENIVGKGEIEIVLVTDGSCGVGTGSLKSIIDAWMQGPEGEKSKCPLPFPFKSKLHIVCMASQNDPDLRNSLPLYQKLIELNNNEGEVHIPEGNLSTTSVNELFTRLAENYFTAFKGMLQCGHLKCNITLFPSPEPYNREDEYNCFHKTVAEKLDICGFMELQDVASPPTISRHLVLPIPSKQKSSSSPSTDSNGQKSKEEEEEEGSDDGKCPSFTVLLHGSLKMEGMVAVTRVAEDWYGILYSWADNKKKSSLMLSLFEPGPDAVSWLGNLNYLTPISDFSEPPYGEDDSRTPFPVRPKEKRSYAQSCVVWIKAVGLQADLQKVIRHARKLPDKQQQFYKELNRIRKAALSFGFTEVLAAMATMLERECTMLPGSAHPDAALQLTHAANSLFSETATDVNQTIVPLRTNFTQEDG